MHVARNAIHMHYPTISLSGIVSPTCFTPIIQRMHTHAQQTAALASTSIPHRIRSQETNILTQFQYRLSKCSELSLGIFTSADESAQIPTYASAAPVYSGAPTRKSVLLGHIVATKTTGTKVDDNDMAIPSDDPSNPSLGNKEEGRTVAIHSLAVLPEFQHKGLGSTIMKAYLDRLAKQDVADKAALIAHEEMIPYYEKFGFKNQGKSSAQFGGGGWFDMVKEISDDEKDDY
jgi:ribosomal protein S18 acetylase RimI-like enzyme